MVAIDNAIKKLKLLGHEMMLLSETAFIGVNKPTGIATCYTVDKDGKLLFKSYDSISIVDDYFVAIDKDSTEILDTNLKILSKFKNEDVEAIREGLVVLYRKSDQAYRLSTLHGKPLSDPIIQHIQLWKQSDNIIVKQHINHDLYKIALIQNDKVVRTIEAVNVINVAVGKRINSDENVVVVQTNDTVTMYNEKLTKILLVANGVKTHHISDKCNVLDKYNNIILTIQLGTKLYG